MSKSVLETEGFASFKDSVYFEPFKYRLPDLRPHDLLVKVIYCGLCHTDLFLAKEEWGPSLTLRPLVAGHEVIGSVIERGPLCKRFNMEDYVGIGFISEACGECAACKARYPAGCEGAGFISTFSAVNIYRHDRCLGTGGFGKLIVINENYAIRIPLALIDRDLPFRCSLLCSGVAIWSSLRQIITKMGLKWPCTRSESKKRQLTIAVVGLGTAGHMAAQIISALGQRLICISSNMRKEVALKLLCPGAEFVSLDDVADLDQYRGIVDILINCSPGHLTLNSVLPMMKAGGTIVALAIPPESHSYQLNMQMLANRQITITGGFIGSLEDAEELLKWVSTEAIRVKSRATVLPISRINEATQMMDKNDLFDGEHFAVVFDLSQ